MIATEHRAGERTDKVNILVVDDNQANLNALEALLDGPDRSVFTALSGNEALRILLKEHVAAILLDVKMDTMDGYETARLIRARDKSHDIPIIFLMAYQQDELDIRKAMHSAPWISSFGRLRRTSLRRRSTALSHCQSGAH
ncbi:MAG: response regulator [Nitrospirales bacterium]